MFVFLRTKKPNEKIKNKNKQKNRKEKSITEPEKTENLPNTGKKNQ
jgi:hypothetical protein